eukprot:scpid37618/ scgid7704/ Ubiquitin carboxyl-terminal hydrolase 22; Deubiquitinating enzyme 22; Ubiquitin thioesterase 22; Ubiquitin-specific-processing protease 22
MRSCSHIEEYKTARANATLQGIASIFLYPYNERARKLKDDSQCMFCESSSNLHVCLSCQFVACKCNEHFSTRMNDQEHFLTVSVATGNLYCHKCQANIYDGDVDNAFCLAAVNAGVKRNRRWLPDEGQAKLLRQSKASLVYMDENSPLGLRGVQNLGNSCFMSSVLQALAHAPVLREYFLSCKPHSCKQTKEVCPMLCFQELFQEFYSGKPQPIVPSKLLHMMWQEAAALAGNQQQDAHEFLIASMTLLHDHLSPSPPALANASKCSSIVDLVFKGFVQSTVTCNKCSNVSPTVEMFWDLSLELPSPVVTKVKSAESTAARAALTTKPVTTKYAPHKNKGRGKNRRKNGKFAPASATVLARERPTTLTPVCTSNDQLQQQDQQQQSVAGSNVINGSTSPAVGSANGVSGKQDQQQPVLTQQQINSASSPPPTPTMQEPTTTTATTTTTALTSPTSGSSRFNGSMRPTLPNLGKQLPALPCTPSSVAHAGGGGSRPTPISSGSGLPSLTMASPPHSPPLLSPTLTLPALSNGGKGASCPQSLVDCLKRYTRKEQLGSEAKIFCEMCNTSQECSKQLRMYETPPVICFHLKRFEQLQLKKRQKKISTFVEFPETLDVSEFMAERENSDSRTKHPLWNTYSLFAVVVHKGQLSQGHYTCFVRQKKNEWYRCDDSAVTRASVNEVLNSESYLLLYHRVIQLGVPATAAESREGCC